MPREPKKAGGWSTSTYQGRWEGKLLELADMLICADAKPSIDAHR